MAEAIAPHVAPGHRGIGLVRRIRCNPLAFFSDLANRCGSHAWLSLMGSPVLFLNDATAIDHVFTRGAANYHKGKYNAGLKPIMGDSVFLAEGELWQRQRRDIAPVFAHGNFAELTRQVTAAVEAMLARWQPRIDAGQPIDLRETSWLTFDVILRALYHQEGGAAATQIRDSLGLFLRMTESRIWSILNLPLGWVLRRPKYRRILAFLDAITAELIARRRADQAYPDDLLSRLLATCAPDAAGQKLLRDNILSFILAGQETTGNALSWAFYELARHTEIRQRLAAEVDNVLGDRTPDFETVKKLDYVRQVWCETLRHYAPVWTMSRHAVAPDILPLDDGRRLAVPENTTLMLCAYTVHHRPDYWEDPESFSPERFAMDRLQTRPRGTWFPYGGGNRLCLGFKLADLEGMLALAMVYRRYRVELVPGQQIRPEPIITLRPDGPVWVVLKPRPG